MIILSAMSVLARTMGPGLPSIALNSLQIQKRDEVNQKVESGEYEFELVACLGCGAHDADVIAERDRYGLFFSVKLCKDCGFVYTSPRMTVGAYGQFYDNEYRPLYVGSERATDAFYREQQNQGRRVYAFLESTGVLGNASMKVLEVGCGAGGILDFFKQKGHEVVGIDLGSEYVNYGKLEHGLDLRVGYLKDLELGYQPDLILYSHVMEHILDPLAEMRDIAAICGPKSLVYIEVPGLLNIHKSYAMDVMKYYQNAHSAHFTLGSLKYLMGKCGFELLKGTQYVRSVFRLGNSGDISLGEYHTVLKYLDFNERYRWAFGITISGIKQRLKRWKVRLLG